MGRKALDLKGQTFGQLIVIKRIENDNWGGSSWLCQCDCGHIKKVSGSHLKTGNTKSCGCLNGYNPNQPVIHGHSRKNMTTKTYTTWERIRRRCNNIHDKSYKWYGLRGITVCERWNDFQHFLADMGEKPEGLTIDRIDNDGNYGPDNCRWATIKEQNRNNRNTKLNTLKVQIIKKLLKESSLTQTAIADIFGVYNTTISEIHSGKRWGDIIYTLQ